MTIGTASAARAQKKDGYRNVILAKLRKMKEVAEVIYTGARGPCATARAQKRKPDFFIACDRDIFEW